MLTCEELTKVVTDYLEGRMGFGARLCFQLHVGMCGHCRRYLGQMKQTVKALGELPDEPMPTDVKNELLTRFRTWND